MAVFETEIKKLRNEMRMGFQELRKLICGKNIVGNWVKQPMACAMISVSPRQLRNIRIHSDKNGKVVGTIRWRKGSGKSVEYYKPDLEKYLSKIVVQ